MNRLFKFFLFILVFFTIGLFVALHQFKSNETKGINVIKIMCEEVDSEIVAAAEEFIKINGYTNIPANQDKLSLETLEWSSSFKKLLT